MTNASDAKRVNELPADQSDRFKQIASELGCDEDEAAFKQKLGQIARHKPKDESARPKGQK
jgi:hypothetical protein